MSTDASALNRELVNRYSRWLAAQAYLPITQSRYCAAANSFLVFLGHRRVTKTTQIEIQDYLAAGAAKGWPVYKIREYLYSLRIFFDFLCLGGLMRWSAPRFIRMKRLRRPLPKVLTGADIRKLLRAAKCPRERMVVEVLYGSGLRSSELLRLKVRDVDFSNRRFIVHGKTGGRSVYFSKRIARVLREYLAGRSTGYLYAFKVVAAPPRILRSPSGGWACEYTEYDRTGKKIGDRERRISHEKKLNYEDARRELLKIVGPGIYSRPMGLKPLNANSLIRDLMSVSARCGVKATARILRHTFATHSRDNGADIRELKEFLGHKALKTTIIYSHMSQIPVKRAYDAHHPEPN